MTNVKAGDLAILIRSAVPENIGRLVHVKERAYPEKWPDGGSDVYVVVGDTATIYDTEGFTGVAWIIESLGAPFSIAYNDSAVSTHRDRVSVAKDSSLRPLRDTDEPDQMPRVTDKELTT